MSEEHRQDLDAMDMEYINSLPPVNGENAEAQDGQVNPAKDLHGLVDLQQAIDCCERARMVVMCQTKAINNAMNQFPAADFHKRISLEE